MNIEIAQLPPVHSYKPFFLGTAEMNRVNVRMWKFVQHREGLLGKPCRARKGKYFISIVNMSEALGITRYTCRG